MIYITSSILIIIILIIILAFLLLALIYKNKFNQSGGEFNSLKNFFVKTKSPTIIPTATMVLLFNSWFYKNNNKNPLDFEFDVVSTIKNSMDNSNLNDVSTAQNSIDKSNNSNLDDRNRKLNSNLNSCSCRQNIFSNCCQPNLINSNPFGPLIKFNTFLYNNQLFTLSPNQLSVSAKTYSDSFYDLYLLSTNEKIKYAIGVCEINSNIYLQINKEKIGGGNNLITFYYTDPENFALIDDFKNSCETINKEKIIDNENMESSNEAIEELSSKRPPKLVGSNLYNENDDYTQFKINDKKFNIIKFNQKILNDSSKNIFNIKYYSNKKNVDIFLDFSYGDNQNIELNFYKIHEFTYLILNKIIDYLETPSSNKNDYTFIIGLLMRKIEWNNLFNALNQFQFNKKSTNELIKSLSIEKENFQFYLLNFNNYDKSPTDQSKNKLTDQSKNKSIVIPPSESFDMDEFLRIATDKLVMNIQIEHSEEYFRHKSNIVEFIMRILNQKISENDQIDIFKEILNFFGFGNSNFNLKFEDNSFIANSNLIFNKSNHFLYLYLLNNSTENQFSELFNKLNNQYSSSDDKSSSVDIDSLKTKIDNLINLINKSETIKNLYSNLQPIEKIDLKTIDQLKEQIKNCYNEFIKPVDKSTDEQIDKLADRSVNELIEPADKSVKKSTDNSTDEQIDKSADKPANKPVNELFNELIELIVLIRKSNNDSLIKSVNESIDKSIDKSINKLIDKSNKNSNDVKNILINFEKFLLGVPIISKIKNKNSKNDKEFLIEDPCCVIDFDKTFPKKII